MDADSGTVELSPTAPTVLEEAQLLVYGDRQVDYGHPRANMAAVAGLITAYMRARGAVMEDLRPGDAAALMTLLKLGRYATGGAKRDTVVDIAGYAAVLARTEGLDE